jgi:hypothetical protein
VEVTTENIKTFIFTPLLSPSLFHNENRSSLQSEKYLTCYYHPPTFSEGNARKQYLCWLTLPTSV